MPKKKRVNPRRIPLPKGAMDKDAILEEAMKDDVAHAWLLVAEPLFEIGYELAPLADSVSDFINRSTKERDKGAILRVERKLGIKMPNLNPEQVKSPVELEAFKKKVWRVALNTALCVVYLGLEKLVPEDVLKKVFFNAQLTLAEIEYGINSFEAIQRGLMEKNAVEIPVEA